MLPVTDDLMLTPEVAKYLRVSPNTIYRLVKRGDFAAPIRLSTKRFAFRRMDVEKWVKSREGFAR